MLRTTITLTCKQQLTHNVYELTYACPDMMKEPPKPGQYVMFQLAPGLNRAYSIAYFSSLSDPTYQHTITPTFTLVIKRVAEGKGSPIICDAEVGTNFSVILPLGHFTLQDTPLAKCFIGTGTGFAPLYCQILAASISDSRPTKVGFIFGVRSFADSFYEDKIQQIGKYFDDFEYIQYFSQETNFEARITDHELRTGYVTDWINAINIKHYAEFYICGSPAMVQSAREKLEALGVSKENIFWEQF